ncbi:hypothetical protein E1B28_003666 [Marasmius oreades]|uniref:Uncharacterized protein n=1 Tax=Marasmius oreades TaxID=181124 RepID=A0A9P7UX10_9AGAR|nr:uncharacterized protein E1B28_003666 [Marasmius oreades]KAG7096214.1 hypothetical protein E1B28_003666 [Marasmius oreades]
MKNSFSTLPLLLLSFLLISGVQADGGCPDGYEPIILDGEAICEEIIHRCVGGEERRYVDSNNARLCCDPREQLVIYDEESRAGVCCGFDQIYTGIKPNGKCCPPKSALNKDGACIPTPTPSSCQGCPAQQPGACQLKVTCGDATTSGLQFGKCYQLLYPNGQQLGRGAFNAEHIDQYAQGGYIQNIPFQICKAPTDCGTGPVRAVDKFYLKDLIGPADGSATYGWIGWPGFSGNHMVLTTSNTPADINQFQGKTSCSSCKCVVQLRAVGPACPAIQPGITIQLNKKVTLKLQFLEVPCNGKFNFPV